MVKRQTVKQVFNASKMKTSCCNACKAPFRESKFKKRTVKRKYN